MKKVTLPALLLAGIALLSFDKYSLLDKKMPLLHNKTLDGKVIDDNYYKGHITLVNFMAIGCMPCMYEISVLNKIQKEYAGDSRFQLLCVARNQGTQMKQFNEDNTSVYGIVRKALNAEPIAYPIQPACDDGESKMTDNKNDSAREINLNIECHTLEETFMVTAVPFNFFVDENGIVRKIHIGGPGEPNSIAFHDLLKREIDSMLAGQ